MASSTARTALDNWLEAAEGLIAEQRTRAISPSLHADSWPDEERRTTQTLDCVATGLESLLGQLTAAPGRWIVVLKDANRPSRIIQFLAYEDGSLVAEVTSKTFLRGRDKWTKRQEEAIAVLGWEPPKPPKRPNWIGIWPTFSPPLDEVVERTLQTLRGVFGLGDDDPVIVKMFSSPLRDNTPASEVVEEVEASDVEEPERLVVPPHPCVVWDIRGMTDEELDRFAEYLATGDWAR
jgi:hypothetical protein